MVCTFHYKTIQDDIKWQTHNIYIHVICFQALSYRTLVYFNTNWYLLFMYHRLAKWCMCPTRGEQCRLELAMSWSKAPQELLAQSLSSPTQWPIIQAWLVSPCTCRCHKHLNTLYQGQWRGDGEGGGGSWCPCFQINKANKSWKLFYCLHNTTKICSEGDPRNDIQPSTNLQNFPINKACSGLYLCVPKILMNTLIGTYKLNHFSCTYVYPPPPKKKKNLKVLHYFVGPVYI